MTRSLDKTLAEELGLTYGAALRELVSGAFLREAAKDCGIRFPLLPWRGARERIAFQLAWSAYLASLSLVVAVRMTPGLDADEKLRRKIFFGTCAFVDAMLSRRASELDPVARESAERLRSRLLRIIETHRLQEEELASRFLELLHGTASDDQRIERLAKLTRRTTELLEKLTRSTLEATPKKQAKH